MRKSKFNRIRKDLNDLRDSDEDKSYWEKYDFNAHVTVYMVENNCSWDEAVEAVQESYEFNPDDYQGINDLSDLIDDELLSEIIDGDNA